MKTQFSYNFGQHNLERLFQICLVSGQPFSIISKEMDAETIEYLRELYGATPECRIRCELSFIEFYDIFQARKPQYETAVEAGADAIKAKENKLPETDLNEASMKMLRAAYEKLNLPPVWIQDVVKTAQAIAQLDASEQIETQHIAEAIQYYSWDRQ